jgi:protein-S-isoprenylcysteine O-methyltransferase Ste14
VTAHNLPGAGCAVTDRAYKENIVMMPEFAMGAVWIAWFISWWAAAAWSDRSVKRPAAFREIPYRLVVTVGLVLLFGLYRSRNSAELMLWHTGAAAGWAMVALAVAVFLFMWWARIVLGRLWSASVRVKEHHRVVDTGPYAMVRHPIYTGIIVAGIATAALRGTAAAFLGAAIMTVSWYIKARMEEGFLREQLGAAEYDAYARRVPMLVPFRMRR